MKYQLILISIFFFLSFFGLGQSDSLEQIPDDLKTCEQGISDANSHVKQSKFKLIEFGMVLLIPKTSTDFKAFYTKYLLEKYQIETVNEGCSPIKYWECYSTTMKELILKKYGNDFFEKTKREARTQYMEAKFKKDTNFIFQFSSVDSMPQFVGGEDSLFRYLGKNTPDYSYHGCGQIQGTVYIQFVVEKDGSLSNFLILRSLEENVDNMALKAIKKMPKWKPAKINDQAIRCRMVIPFKFVL